MKREAVNTVNEDEVGETPLMWACVLSGREEDSNGYEGLYLQCTYNNHNIKVSTMSKFWQMISHKKFFCLK